MGVAMGSGMNELSGEQIDRIYHVLMVGMGCAFLTGMLFQWGLAKVFGWCG